MTPTHADTAFNLANALRGLGRPRYPEALNNLGNLHKELGEFSAAGAAIECFRTALDLDPANAATHSNLAYSLSFQSLDADPLLEECRRWNARCARSSSVARSWTGRDLGKISKTPTGGRGGRIAVRQSRTARAACVPLGV